MSNTSDQTTKPSKKTRLIIGEVGVDTETGIVGKGHSYDNGKTFTVDDTIYGRIYHADDHGKIWKGIQDKVETVVKPAKSAADSAATVASDAKSNATVAVQTASGASVQIKNAQGDISKLQARAGTIEASVANNSGAVADVQATANQLKASVSDNSGAIVVAKQTADSAVTVASDARSNATVASQTASQASITASNASGQAASAVLTAQGALTTASNAQSDATVAVQTASGASLTATNAKNDATVAKQTASEAKVQASNAESDFAQLSIRANKIEANVANNSGAIANVQQTANGLMTTVADIKANGGGVNLAKGTSSEDQSVGDASQTTGWQLPTIATFDNPQAGQQYTISVNARNNGGSWRIDFWDGTSPTNRANWIASGNSFTSTQGQKHTATITWPSGSNKYLIVQLVNKNDGGQIFWNSAMLEEGTVAHTWSPAPDDLQNQFTQTKQTVDGIATTINDAIKKSRVNSQAIVAQGEAISEAKSAIDSATAEIQQANATTTVSSGDLNNCTTTGKYYMPNSLSSYTNHPTTETDMSDWFVMKVDVYQGAPVIVQTIYQLNSGDVWVRLKQGSTWQSWRQINFQG